mmetsp:Transcript_9903/g.23217  ORF Transcript_9903/g.23217 Transcript_9903/m.23217 type:complete len:278 (-) Transcript_9903:127-960(-)
MGHQLGHRHLQRMHRLVMVLGGVGQHLGHVQHGRNQREGPRLQRRIGVLEGCHQRRREMPVRREARGHVGMGAAEAVLFQRKAAARFGRVGLHIGHQLGFFQGHQQLAGAQHQPREIGRVGGAAGGAQQPRQGAGVVGRGQAVAPEECPVQARHLGEGPGQAGGHGQIAQDFEPQGMRGVDDRRDLVRGAVVRGIRQPQHLGRERRVLLDQCRNLGQPDVVVIEALQQPRGHFGHRRQGMVLEEKALCGNGHFRPPANVVRPSLGRRQAPRHRGAQR